MVLPCIGAFIARISIPIEGDSAVGAESSSETQLWEAGSSGVTFWKMQYHISSCMAGAYAQNAFS